MEAEEFLICFKSLAGQCAGHGCSFLPGDSGPDHSLIRRGYEGQEVGKISGRIFQPGRLFLICIAFFLDFSARMEPVPAVPGFIFKNAQ
jgi:hypothetical protein